MGKGNKKFPIIHKNVLVSIARLMRVCNQLMPTAVVKNGKAMQNLTVGPMSFQL
jgi:hypothetical protein